MIEISESLSIFICNKIVLNSSQHGVTVQLEKMKCFLRENTWHLARGIHGRLILREPRTDVKK